VGIDTAPGAPPALADVVALLEAAYDPATAEDWDRVGLVAGDPAQPVSRVLFAVDPLPQVAAEAVQWGADLLVTHHPLLLRGVHSVAATTAKGRTVHDLIASSCALLTLHTNADAAHDGVNDALADAVGMRPERRPLRPIPDGDIVRVVVHVTPEHTDALVAAMAAAGAGTIGDYDFCAYWVDGTGQFRPLSGAQPAIGAVGALERVQERRVEMVLPRGRVSSVVHALREAHPYEEPAFSIVDTVPLPGARGIGRVGAVAEVELADLADRLADALPATAHGIRVAGDPRRVLHSVAVCGGAGDSLLPDVARCGADAYVTSDLRHHPAAEFRADHPVALLDIAHWAGEWLWLQRAADRLAGQVSAAGGRVDVRVSALNTDPWTFSVARTSSEEVR
jgi:dinuclear metal center YbgI/SA1388 family protein